MKIRWNNEWVDMRALPGIFVEDPEDPGNYVASEIYIGETDPVVAGEVPYAWIKPSDFTSASTVTFDDTGLVVATGGTVQDALESLDGQFTYANYTPTISQSATVTTSALYARYIHIGKFVQAYGYAVVSSAGTTNQPVQVTLPATASSVYNVSVLDNLLGPGMVADTGTIWNPVLCALRGTGAIGFVKSYDANESWVGQNPNFALASGDRIGWNITYEAA